MVVSSDGLTITANTTWQDVFDSLGIGDQDCIRGALGDSLENAIRQTEIGREQIGKLLPCLNPEASREILPVAFTAALVADGWELSQEEVACLRREIGVIDVLDYVSREHKAAEDFGRGTVLCVPKPVIYQFVGGLGVERGELSENEVSCLQQELLDFNWTTILADESAGSGDLLAVLFVCVPDPVISSLISGFGIGVDDLDDSEASCLKAQLASFDWSAVQKDESAAVTAVISDLFLCLPVRIASRIVAESGMSDILGFDPEDLSEEEYLCIGNSMASLDWIALVTDDPAADAEFADALFSCTPKLFITSMINEFGLEMEHLEREEEACLSEWASGLDWRGILADDAGALRSMGAGLQDCLPEILLPEGSAATG